MKKKFGMCILMTAQCMYGGTDMFWKKKNKEILKINFPDSKAKATIDMNAVVYITLFGNVVTIVFSSGKELPFTVCTPEKANEVYVSIVKYFDVN